ncbi:MAG: hypothetical protein A2Z52_01860 [Candidatus Moranbacteria bacterium RBG_19FT_COMBO_42_6]|nr:MAG: hypothetical protein A2Z52_01860 [Candidatus Moranbacteria bacterium RBG_19FT_COMBO_42_6]
MDILRNKPVGKRSEENEGFISENARRFHYETAPEASSSGTHLQRALISWQAPEFEVYEKDNKWYAYISLILIAIIGYAVYSNSLIMAIAFILIGVILYIQLHKEPKIIDFALTTDGVVAGREIFEFDQIRSFWIFYDPPHEKYISFHTKGHLVPFIHIAIDDQNPVELRRILIKYIPEIKQEPNLVDMLERFLRI